jgi:hypothetical protein
MASWQLAPRRLIQPEPTMGKFGTTTPLIAVAGAALLVIAGCSNSSPSGEFQSYDHLKKPGVAETDATIGEKIAAPPTAPQPLANADTLGRPNAVQPAAATAPAKPAVAVAVATATAISSGVASPSPKGLSPASPSSTLASGTPASSISVRASGSASRKVQVLVPSRDFKSEGREAALRVSYDDIDLLKILNMEPVTPDAPSLMPPWLKKLDGRRIRIRGFMYPTFQESDIRAFGLARDNQICCFGRTPKIYDVFDVALRDGVTTSYIPNRPFDVVGVFHIRPEAEEGKLSRLYEMDDAIVITK